MRPDCMDAFSLLGNQSKLFVLFRTRSSFWESGGGEQDRQREWECRSQWNWELSAITAISQPTIHLVQLTLIDVINKRACVIWVYHALRVFRILIGRNDREEKHAQKHWSFDVRANMQVQPIQLADWLADTQTKQMDHIFKLYRDLTTSGCILVCHIMLNAHWIRW